MILKHYRSGFPIIISVVLIFSLSLLTIKSYYFEKYKLELPAYLMSFDPGFSSAGTVSVYLRRLRSNLSQAVAGKLFGFDGRPSIERIAIDIKFSDMETLREDRKRALHDSILSDSTTVAAKIRFSGETFKAKVRLKGDLTDHWTAPTRMSLRVRLKGNAAILGFKAFSIHRPAARQYPYDQVFQELHQEMDGLSSAHNFARIYVNGNDWGVMHLEEHMSKELLEKQKRKESLIVRFGSEEKWKYNKKRPSTLNVPRYKLGDNVLNVKLYQQDKYLENPNYRRQLSYIASQRLLEEASHLYNIDKFSRALIFGEIWNNRHTLAHSNTRYYFNPYLLKLEPVTTDQGRLHAWENGRGGSSFDPLQYALYQNVVTSHKFNENFENNFSAVTNAISHAPDIIKFYKSFFPLDGELPIFQKQTFKNNISYVSKNPADYLPPAENSTVCLDDEDNASLHVSSEAASYLPAHIHARHYTDGTVEVFNLLPTEIKILALLFEGKRVKTVNKMLDPHSDGCHQPGYSFISNYRDEQDGKLSLQTEVSGQIRTFTIPATYSSEPLFNPLVTSNEDRHKFLDKVGHKAWAVKAGSWVVSEPLRIHGDLFIPAGVNLSFFDNAYLMINGALIAAGTESSPVVMRPTGESWKGVYVYDAKGHSILTYTKILSTRATEVGLLKLTGGVTFYDADVSISNSIIDATGAEDALNIIHSEFSIDKLNVSSTVSDGFDGDFSVGEVRDSRFSNIGGDALDFSGSAVRIVNSVVRNVEDKAVSVGEASNVSVEGGQYLSVGVAFASKDGSTADVSNVTVSDASLSVAMTYKKKPFYGEPSLVLRSSQLPKDSRFLRQEDTILRVDGVDVAEEKVNVKSLYEQGVMRKNDS